MDSKLFVFEHTMKAWGSEYTYVQNIRTTVCTHYKLSGAAVCTCYKIIKPTVCTLYKLIRTAVCTCYKIIYTSVCIQSLSLSVSSFTLQLLIFLPVTSHFIKIFFSHTDPLYGSAFVIYDTFVTGNDCFWWLVNGKHNSYGYNAFCYCSGIC
jgi:hypothetical protein